MTSEEKLNKVIEESVLGIRDSLGQVSKRVHELEETMAKASEQAEGHSASMRELTFALVFFALVQATAVVTSLFL